MTNPNNHILRLIFMGSWLTLKDYVDKYEIIDSSSFELKDAANTLIVLFPLSVQQQSELLKYSEESSRDIILHFPRFYSILDTLKSRYMIKIDNTYSVDFNKDKLKHIHLSLLSYYLNSGYLNKSLNILNNRLQDNS